MDAKSRLTATVDALCAANPDSPFARLRAATIEARNRTGKPVGTAVKQGAFSVCLTFYAGKRTTVEVLADGLTVDGAIEFMNAMPSVADDIRAKVAAGHAYVSRTMGGVLHVALYYGHGQCSSAFVPAPDMHGPAKLPN